MLLYLLINLDYLEYQVINKSEHYTLLNIKFFYSYFFNMFFGSIVFGGLMLFLFSYFFLIDIIRNIKIYGYNFFLFFKKKKIEDIFLIIILINYILIIAYSIFRAPIMAAKYVPFLLPIIIIWISYKIYILKKKYLYFCVIFFSILNVSIYWNDIQIDRPPIKKILSEIKQSDTNKIFTTQDQVFNHYLNNYNLSINNNLKFYKFKDYSLNELPKKFWFFCLNNARYEIGENKLPDADKCFSFKKYNDLNLIKTIRKPDILLHLIEKKNY